MTDLRPRSACASVVSNTAQNQTPSLTAMTMTPTVKMGFDNFPVAYWATALSLAAFRKLQFGYCSGELIAKRYLRDAQSLISQNILV